jgi:uncharacterized membrane protein YeiH
MASVAGGLAYFGLKQTTLDADISKIICILVIFLVRLLAVRYRIKLPLFYAKMNS